MIDHNYIYDLLEQSKDISNKDIKEVLERAKHKKGLSHRDISILLQASEKEDLKEIFTIAGDIKRDIYGNRIVIFAPLYLSDYCVNNCSYCGYKRDNKFTRRKLTMGEIEEEVQQLEKMGHKRLALEYGEDPVNCDIDYVIDSIKAVYGTHIENGNIRRANVNIAATTVENYKRLKDADIGTYILFQETYHRDTYEEVHPKSLKTDYNYHLNAFDRAIEAGIEDVGGGVLFGLYDYKFEVLSLMIHNDHLEKEFGVGFHTISVPRLKKAKGMDLDIYPHIVNDEEFKKIVAIIRLAVPYTGIILSTRESQEMRKEVIEYGVSQISAGSCTGVGGYKENGESSNQFDVSDNRKPLEAIKELILEGHLPSYCTACYRMNRTGDRFMELAKTGEIHNVCTPNALMTLMEYAIDYGDMDFQNGVEELIHKEIENIDRPKIKTLVRDNIEKIKSGQRDLYL